jgi:hypothetical protein
VSGATAYLYATNYTIADLDPTYLYGIADTLSNTTPPGTNSTFTLLATAPADSNFKGVSLAPATPPTTQWITLLSSPSGIAVASAGSGCEAGSYATPQVLNWTPNSTCTLSVISPQSAGTGVQYAFSQWSDGTTNTSDTFTAPPSAATYTASYNLQYLLTTSAGTGGTASAGGYFNSRANATIAATPSAGYYFVGFTVGSTTFTTNPLVLPVSAPTSVTANFALMATPSIAWATPAAIAFGSALSAVQLDATASVAGTFVYAPAAGTVLPAGAGQTLSATFTPIDTVHYTTATQTTAITVNPAPATTPANLVVTKTLTRTGGNVVVQFTIANTGGTAAANVALTSVKVGADTATPLPQSIGTIAAGATAQATVSVPGTVGASGAASSLTLSGTYTGGTFSSSARITLP